MAFLADTAATDAIFGRHSAKRRREPRPIDTDWLVLKGLTAAVEAMVPRIARPGGVALDFGCGSRPYASLFQDAGMTYVGADFSGGDVTIDAAGHIGAPDASCDLVLSFQVLEHVRDLTTYFAEARRVLRPGGRLLLSTHGSWLYHPHPEDHRRWTREGLVAEMADHGFVTSDCVPVVGPLAWTTILRLTGAAYALRKIPAVGGAVAAALAVVMNARAVVEDAVTPAWITRENACVYVTLSAPAEPRG
jgi:SAM-dependent methyltransferase